MAMAPLKRRAWLFVGTAILISLVLAIPIEQLNHEGYPPHAYWPHSCSDAQIGLNIGNVVQALLTPLFVFVLPGVGSILRTRSQTVASFFALPEAPVSVDYGEAKGTSIHPRIWLRSVKFVVAGWLFAVAVSLAWWFLVRATSSIEENCPALYNWDLPVHRYKPDVVLDFFHYYIYVSLFAAFWIGIATGALRAQCARASEDSVTSGQFESFYWACFLGWAVQYRVSQWFATPNRNQDWVAFSCLDFIFSIVSSFCVLPFIRRMWNKQIRSWWMAFVDALGKSFLIYGLTFLCFIWLVVYAFLPIVPAFVTWDAFGLLWAVVIGAWRCRALKEKQAFVTGHGL